MSAPVTANGPADIFDDISRRLATKTVEQVADVGERTGWWTIDDVDWVFAGNPGPRPEGWTLETTSTGPAAPAPWSQPDHDVRGDLAAALVDSQTPTEGTASSGTAGDAAGTAPAPMEPGHGNAGPDAQPQVSPSRSHPGKGGGPGASEAPAEPPATGRRACQQCGHRITGRRGDAKYCSPACNARAWRARKASTPAAPASETPPAAADSGEANRRTTHVSCETSVPVADHRPAPPADPAPADPPPAQSRAGPARRRSRPPRPADPGPR